MISEMLDECHLGRLRSHADYHYNLRYWLLNRFIMKRSHHNGTFLTCANYRHAQTISAYFNGKRPVCATSLSCSGGPCRIRTYDQGIMSGYMGSEWLACGELQRSDVHIYNARSAPVASREWLDVGSDPFLTPRNKVSMGLRILPTASIAIVACSPPTY